MAPRGKFSKPTRGGGKRFSRNVQPVDKHGNPVGLWRDPEDDPASSSSSEEEVDESDSESDSAGEGPSADTSQSQAPGEAEMTREERRAAARAKKQSAMERRKQFAAQPGDLPPSDSEEDDELPANPNHTAKARSQLQEPQSSRKPNGDLSQLSRREREAIEAQQERDRYMKLHAEGKTEEARQDLARLALIRERREAERARKEAEKEEKAEEAKQRAAAREQEMKARETTKGKKKGAPKKK